MGVSCYIHAYNYVQNTHEHNRESYREFPDGPLEGLGRHKYWLNPGETNMLILFNEVLSNCIQRGIKIVKFYFKNRIHFVKIKHCSL